MATDSSLTYETGFIVGESEVRFGILWGADPILMTDWTRQNRDVEIEGIGGLTVIQLMGSGPRQITYRLFFEDVTDFQALDDLVQETGTLRIFRYGHSVPLSRTDHRTMHGKRYSEVTNVLLRSLVSAGVAVDGGVEADATFVVAS